LLNLARALQGVGAAAMFAVSLALIASISSAAVSEAWPWACTGRRSAWPSPSARWSAAL
jgi:hypothetical protein